MQVHSLKYENPKFQVEIDWNITERCNYSCSYCASYDNSQPFNFKSFDEYIECFKYLSDYFGNKTIRIEFLGGEPTLYKKWVELVNWLVEYNYKPYLTTNLSVPVNNYIHKLNPKLKKFIIASFHTEFTPIDVFIENAKILNDYRFLKRITFLPHPKSWEESMKQYEKLKTAGDVRAHKIKDEFSSGISISKGFLEYTENQLKFFKINKQTNKHMKLTVDGKIKTPSIDIIREKYSNFKGMKCAVGFTRLHIKSNGDVYPSACLSNYKIAKMGNIYKKNLIKPKTAISCPFTECLCGPDIRTEKWLDK